MSCLRSAAFRDNEILDSIERSYHEKIPVKVEDSKEDLQKRLAELRTHIGDAKVDWYVVPSEDEHQSEEIGESDERRSWISGFTGSAGTALIPASDEYKALLFVDSRYWIQAEKQVPEGWEVRRVGSRGGTGPSDVVGGWTDAVVDELEDGSRVGIDPKLIAYGTVQAIQSRLDSSSTELIAVDKNLIDKIRSLPPRSTSPIVPHPLKFSGETTSSKLAKLRAVLDKKAKKGWIYVLPTLPAIAWLLNIRCPGDIPYVPVAYAYLVLSRDDCAVFVDKRKVDDGLQTLLDADGVEVRDYGVGEVGKYVQNAVSKVRAQDEKWAVKVFAPKECSWALAKACEPSTVDLVTPCPVDVTKGVKNKVEIEGARRAYLRDGRAMVRWMAWLEQKILRDGRPVGEWVAAQGLLRYRRLEENFAGLAYGDISGSGPNGALPHYAPQRGAESPIDPDATYVIDSGGQYLDGTIDTTRTLYLGKTPSDDVKRAYTRVLQAHMTAARAVFPRGIDADRLVMLGKAALYEDGLDYGHGLGHGIGSYLAVHEFPIFPHGVFFEPGHMTSIEPGFYKEKEWGIRTESVYVCKSVDTKYEFGGHQWLGWERLTQVPIMTNLVDWSLMRKDQIQWLNDHNKDVKDALWPLLQEDQDKDTRDWLDKACKPKKIWPWT